MQPMATESLEKSNPLMAMKFRQGEFFAFEQLKPEHFMPALAGALDQARERLTSLRNLTEPPTFANTIETLDSLTDRVDFISTVFYNLLGTDSTDLLQDLAQKIGPQISAFASELILDEAVFARVRAVHAKKTEMQLSPEQMQLLANTHSEFERNGALLQGPQKARLKEIDRELSQLAPTFSQNLLKATNQFELWLADPADLDGLPDDFVEMCKATATEKDRSSEWLVTLQPPSYVAFLKYSTRRALRERLWRAYNSRALHGEFSNQDLILKMIRLKFERAQLLGFESHAHFVLEKRMAETPEKVFSFLDKLVRASKPAALDEIADLQKFATNYSPCPLEGQLMPWDFSFYSERQKEKLFSLKEEDLKCYFPLEQVLAGVFEHARRLYNLEFRATTKPTAYHSEVKVFEVWDTERCEVAGLLYTDFFPRESKRAGAWMTNYREQGILEGELVRPHVSIVCNFTPPTATKPSLLTFDEVSTLFHEFGHALHSLLSRCHYRSLSGTNVYWDFVELPSQIMENWALETESLGIFAKHFKTAEVIPQNFVEKLKAAAQYQAGYACLRQVSLAVLDMKWHCTPASQIDDVETFELAVTEELRSFAHVDGTLMSPTFAHIFGGGYSAGYYSYKWAEVLDADAFEMFKEQGVFNKVVATKFKDSILSKGGSFHPMELFKAFRGREPDPEALLRRDGLLQRTLAKSQELNQ